MNEVIDYSVLAGSAGFDFSGTLSVPARQEYARQIASDMRDLEATQTKKTEIMVNLVSRCADIAEATELFKVAEQTMKAANGNNASGGKPLKSLDKSYVPMKSTLLRGFKLGVLPAKEYKSYSKVRTETKALGDKAAKAAKAELARGIIAGAPMSEEDMIKAVKTAHEAAIAWVITLPITSQLDYWIGCEPVQALVTAELKKAIQVLAGTEPKKSKKQKADPAAIADPATIAA